MHEAEDVGHAVRRNAKHKEMPRLPNASGWIGNPSTTVLDVVNSDTLPQLPAPPYPRSVRVLGDVLHRRDQQNRVALSCRHAKGIFAFGQNFVELRAGK